MVAANPVIAQGLRFLIGVLKTKASLALGTSLLLVGIGYLSADLLSKPDRGPRDGSWERIRSNGYLIVGVDPSIPPFGQDTPQGPVGLDPALGREIATRLGLEVRYILLSYDGLYDALLLGEADIVVAALRPDPLRTDRVRYTTPYFDAGHVLISPAQQFDSLEALGSRVLAVEFASEGDIAARSSAVEIERYFTAAEAIDAALNGEADAALVDFVSAALHPAAPKPPPPIIPDPYVIAVRRHDWRLFQAVENTVRDMQADGTLARLHEVWIR